jgi:sulfatase modifying factor 1
VLNAQYPAQNGLYALVWEVLSGISALLLLRYAWFPEFGAKAGQINPARSADKAHVLQRIADNIVAVEGGTFTMGCTEEQGSECSGREKPAHSVTLSNYSIGKYLVTQDEWEVVMGKNPSRFQGARRPVEQVSWNDIQQFLERLNQLTGKNYRLPTEAEWEYAARGGKHSKGFKYSGSNDIDDVAWYGENAASETKTVGLKQPNELGLYDMSGNVWEWCFDWYGPYSGGSEVNPKGAGTGAVRVLRGGGGWGIAQYCRVSVRDGNRPEDRLIRGFRLVSPGS